MKPVKVFLMQLESLSADGTLSYEVSGLINTTTPKIGEVLTLTQVNTLVSTAGTTVEIE